MRASRRARAGEGSSELQMGPLIDAVFLLLTYFLFTISLSTMEGLLPAKLALGNQSENPTEQNQDQTTVVIRIVQTGTQVQYFIDDWPVNNYQAVVKHLGDTTKDSTIVIDSGPNVTYKYVIGLYNECLRFQFPQIVFPLATGSDGMLGSAPRS